MSALEKWMGSSHLRKDSIATLTFSVACDEFLGAFSSKSSEILFSHVSCNQWK